MESSNVNHRMITRSKLIEDSEKPVNKDSSKRSADPLPDVGSKKRILGDITNQPKASNIKKNINTRKNKANRHESENSVLTISDENYSKSNTISEKQSLSKKRSNSEILSEAGSSPKKSISELELIDNDTVSDKESPQSSKASGDDSIYISALEDSLKFSSAARYKKIIQFPEGVEDFDKSCLKDPFSESRYASDIFSYYLEREKLFPVKKYLHHQKDMTKGMRAILVDWMVEVQESFELNHETLYLAVKLVDLYLMKNRVSKNYLQLVGATAICIAAKFDERQPPLVDDFLYICDDSYTREQLIETEIKMLQTVEFDLGIPLSYRFLRRFARCARMSMEMLTLARYILETSLMDYELIEILDSKVAAGALLLALRMKNQKWTPTHEFYTGYKEKDLQNIVCALNKNISSSIHSLQTIRTKYSHPVFFEVSKIAPLKSVEI